MPDDEIINLTPEVPVVREQTADEIDQAVAELGLIPIDHRFTQRLSKVGVGLDQLGVTKVAKGAIYATIPALMKALQKLTTKLEEPDLTIENLRTLSYTIGYVSDKIGKASKTSTDIDESGRVVREEADKRRRQSFLPGTLVQHNYYGTVPDKNN